MIGKNLIILGMIVILTTAIFSGCNEKVDNGQDKTYDGDNNGDFVPPPPPRLVP